MTSRQRLCLLVLVLTAACVIVTAVATAVLYEASFRKQQDRLRETAQSQARLIESIARHEMSYVELVKGTSDHGDAFAATLAQLRDAHSRFRGFGKTGEFTLARREGNRIVKEHHGKLHCASEPGQRTMFHLDLPADNGWTLDAV